MQEFVIKAKNTIKRIAAISVGAVMLGATAFGAVAAADLSDYPAPFVDDGQWIGLIVVGADAQAGDIVGATDIAASLAQQTTTAAEGTTTTVTGGKSKEIAIGTYLNDSTNAFGSNLDDDDIAGFLDSTVTFDTASGSKSYDVHEEIRFDQTSSAGAKITTGLDYSDNRDEGFKEDVFLAVPRGSIAYYYVFDKDLDEAYKIGMATSTYPREIKFLGKTLKIIDAGNNTITAEVGTEYFLTVGDSVTVNDKVVTLKNVASCSASPCSVIVDVDGVQETIGTTAETVNGLKIEPQETFYSDTLAERSATLLIGEDTTKSYDDGDPYIGQDENDPDWVWDLEYLNTSDKSGITIGIKYDQVLDDPTDNPPTVGSENNKICAPDDYFCIILDSYKITDYKKYTFETETGLELYHSTSDTTPHTTSAKCIHIHADGGSKNGLDLNGQDTDDVYLCINSTTTEVEPYYKSHSAGNKLIAVPTKAVSESLNTFTNDVFSITYKDTTIGVDIWWNATQGVNLTIDETGSGGATNNLQIYFKNDTPTTFSYLGHSDGDTTTANDIKYNDIDISGWKENTRTKAGIIIYDPEASDSADKLEIDVPSDYGSDFKINVIVSGPETTISKTGAGVTINSIAGVPLVKLDTEVGAADKEKPLIIVGDSCVNKLAAEVAGVGYPTCGDALTETFGFGPDEAVIKLYENAFGGTNVAMVVAGWEAKDTRNAANVLKDFASYSAELKGKAVKVVGTTVTAIAETPAVTEETEETTEGTE